MYEYNGSSITEANIQEYADVNNMTYNDAFNQLTNAGMKEISVTPEPEEIPWYEDLSASFAKSFADTFGGIATYATGIEASMRSGVKELMLGRELTEKERMVEFAKVDLLGKYGNISRAMESVSKSLEDNIEKPTSTISEDLLNKNWAKAGYGIVKGIVSSAPSLVAAAAGPAGLILLGSGVAGNKFKEELEKDPSRDMGELLFNATGTGAIEAGFEMATRGLLKKAGIVNAQSGAKAAKELLQGGAKELIKSFGSAAVKEGGSEALTELTNELFDVATLGKEIDTKELLFRMGDAFAIGAGMGTSIASAGGIKKLDPNTKNRAYDALMSDTDKIKVQAIGNEINKLAEDLPEASESGKELIGERIKNLKNTADKIYGMNRVVLSGLNTDEINNYVENVENQNKIKRDFAGLTTESEKQLANEKYKTLQEANNDILKAAETRITQKNIEESKVLAEEIGLQLESFAELNDFVQNAVNEGLTEEEAIKADGFITKDGKVLINETRAKEAGAISVGSHELLHGVIGNSFNKLDTNQRETLVKDFFNQLSDAQQTAVKRRLNEDYKITGDDVFQSEEVFTAFSDAINKNEITFEETVFDKLKTFFQKIFKKQNYGKEFENGKQVYDFLKDYSKSFKTGKLSKRVKEFAKVDAVTGVDKPSYTKTPRDNRIDTIGEKYTKEQWDSRGADEAVGELYMSGDLEAIVKNNLSSALRDLPGFSEEDFISETIAELIPHIKNFNIDRKKDQAGFGLSGWIRGQVNNKIGNVLKAKKATREAFESDIEESTQAQVAVAEEQAPAIEEEDISVAAQVKKAKAIKEEGIEEGVEYSTTRRVLTVNGEQGIPELIINKVKDAVVKTMATEKTTPSSDKFIANVKKAYLTELKKPIQDMMGKGSQFDNFLKENKEAIITALPTSTLVQIERNVKPEDRIFTVEIKKNLSPTEVDEAIANDQLPKGTNRNSGPSLYEKRMPSTKEFVDFYNPPAQVFSEKLGAMVRSGLKGTRKDTLAEQLGIELAFDATMEVVQSPEVMERRAMVTNTDFADAQISELAKAIGRGVDIKFSKTDISDINDITKEINKKGLSKVLEQDLDTIGKKLGVDFNLNRTVEDYKNVTDIPSVKKAIEDNFKSKKPKAIYEVVEQTLIDNLIANENDFISVELRRAAEGVNPDALIDFVGTPVGIETKADTARTPSRTIAIDLARYAKDKSFDYKDSYDNAAIESLVAKAMPDIIKIQKFLKNKYNLDWNGSDVKLTPAQWQQLGFEGLRASVANSVMVDSDFASFDYLNKAIPSEYINLGLAGLFKMGNGDPLYLQNNISEFGGVKIPLTVRLVRSKLNKEGKYRVTLKIEGQLDYRDFAKQKYNLFKKADAKTIIDNASKIAKDKKEADIKKPKLSKTKGISVLDFDDTLATSKSLIKFTKPDGSKGTLTPEQYASTYEDLLDLGYKFDFSEFSKVVDGKPAPLLNKAKKLASKFGTKDMFVLTARPADSAPAIQEFLKENGLDIPLRNIVGLGNSTAEAKALWIADKAAEGYNDFYFADDALKNVQAVQNMLDQFDVKSKVQQAKVKFSQTNIDERLNKMLETNKGVPAEEIFEKARAKQLGRDKGKYEFFISAGADDFAGLMTRLAGKGKQGDEDMKFFKEFLFDPYNRAYRQINEYNYNMINDYNELINDNPEIKKQLTRKFGDTDFTTQQAIRIYLWDEAGYDIPGMSDEEVQAISSEVARNSDLRYFANLLSRIPKTEYPKPKDHWVVENIKADLYNASEANRAEFLQQWQENADVLFSDKNLNKLEATMGSYYVNALKDSLFRMKTGKNRPTGPDGEVNKWLNWVNNSVGAIMFFNARSAVLQTISTVNYLDFENNNVFKAAKAFANQKQYWKDFSFLFNSPTLKQRRAGIQTDVSASDIADAVRDKRNPVQAALAYLLRIGFTPTQIADSFAISAGGATYYRNQVNYYREQGMTIEQAEEKAFNDFQEKTEEAQQSSRPDKISKQQASVLGRLILAFQNTPMQYNRIIKKAVLDLVNRRGSDKANISRIIYYGTAQSIIFSALQNALFALAFDDEKEDEEKEKFATKKQSRIIDSMISTLLRGSGLTGAVADTLVKVYKRFAEEKEKGWKADYGNVLVDAANISPPMGSKLRKLYSAMKTVKFNQDAIDAMSPLDINNPLYDATSSAIEAGTNIPAQRIYRKISNMNAALTEDIAPWQRIALSLGWSRWDLGLDTPQDIVEAKEEAKEARKTEGTRCTAITSSGKRCKNRTDNKSGRCYAHE